jgi:hypothetical protein
MVGAHGPDIRSSQYVRSKFVKSSFPMSNVDSDSKFEFYAKKYAAETKSNIYNNGTS